MDDLTMNEPKASVIIPAYNEAQNIGNLIKEIKKINSGYEIILVDDGSEDNTSEIARSFNIKLIKHPYNIGNGGAIKTGTRHAKGKILVFMDADGQHDPKDIPRLLDHMNQYDMVVGARSKFSDVSKLRTISNYCLIKLANYLSGEKIDDLTSGFRAIKKERMMEFLHLLPNTFSYPSTITLALLRSGYPVRYVALSSIKKRRLGKSKINLFKDGFKFIMLVIRIIMLFDPLKIFLPSSLILLGLGIVFLTYNLFALKGIQESSMLLIIVGVLVFFFGLLAEQISQIRRELRSDKS